MSLPLLTAKKLLIHHEGLRLTPYRDTMGNLTLGYGRNLEDRGISPSEAEHLLANDIISTYKALDERLPWFKDLDEVRKMALMDMAFNLGVAGLLEFKGMLRALKAKHWAMAAIEALDSDWHVQVGQRARDIADMLQTGELMQL